MCFRNLVLGLLRGRLGGILAPIWEPKTSVLFHDDLAVDKMRKSMDLITLARIPTIFRVEMVENV